MRISGLLISLLLISSTSAQTTNQTSTPQAPVDNSFAVTNWVSVNSSSTITINNSLGIPILIVITVNPNGAGIDVTNCGSTTRVDAGSSTICKSADSRNNVTISSESTADPASGTYQIKQQILEENQQQPPQQ